MSDADRYGTAKHSYIGRASTTVMIGTLLAILLVIAGPDRSSEATSLGTNGRLTYHTDADDPGNIYEIYTIEPDGTNPLRLTTDEQGAKNPAWSADGGRIAFENFAPPDFFSDVYVMDADGSNSVRVTDSAAGGPGSSDGNPSWSPDGTQLALEGRRNGNRDIYSINIDGTGRTNLTNDSAEDTAPAWSPDGESIAFVKFAVGTQEIYVMSADGQNQTNLTNDPASDRDPSWSPDSSKIAFSRAGDIYVMNADGSQQTQLTDDPERDAEPAWSPDGEKIAFVSERDGEAELFVMNADGTEETQITDDDVEQRAPDWGPIPETPEPTPGVWQRLWGDVDCSNAINPVDSLKLLRWDAGLSVTYATPECPPIGGAVPGSVPATPWGDIDCSGEPNPIDSLKTLRYDAGLSVDQAAGCPQIGSPT